MVSIAESFNYRIFERKRRMGEALLSHPRACHILSVEQKTTHTYICTYIYMHIVVYFCVCVCVWIAYLLEMGKVLCGVWGVCKDVRMCMSLSLYIVHKHSLLRCLRSKRHTRTRARFIYIHVYIYITMYVCMCITYKLCACVCVGLL